MARSNDARQIAEHRQSGELAWKSKSPKTYAAELGEGRLRGEVPLARAHNSPPTSRAGVSRNTFHAQHFAPRRTSASGEPDGGLVFTIKPP